MIEPGNIREFEKAIDDYTENEIPKQVIKIQKAIAIEALTRIVMRTPVDTGRARGNWQLSIGSGVETALETIDRGGGQTIESGVQNLLPLKPYELIVLSNNVHYIEFLENGSSQRSPEGMVAVVLEELKTIFSNYVDE